MDVLEDLMRAAMCEMRYSKVMITKHPQRWTDSIKHM